MKKWQLAWEESLGDKDYLAENIVKILLKSRGIVGSKNSNDFLHPLDPYALKASEVGIDKKSLEAALVRIRTATQKRQSIVVYADYDADGITAGAIMWETLHQLGASVMPYIPHRVEEGYGLSLKGLDTIRSLYDPSLVITVDHGITAREKIAYARKLGMEVIVTDHHVKPKNLPECTVIHTTALSGAGVAWFVAKQLLQEPRDELLALAAVGTIADMVPLVGPNRSLVKWGLLALNKTKRVGLEALITEAGLTKGSLGTYEISHILAPRLNAMGRLEHALDALRLLCTRQSDKAVFLARRLGLTNRQRQQLTEQTALHALARVSDRKQKLLFISHESYNQGVIGLVAGRLVEEYYRPAIVVSRGEVYSKASARSITGFNIVEAIRTCSDILVDMGGHPMAAGFTVETKHLEELERRLEELAEKELDEDKLTRKLKIDLSLPLKAVSFDLWKKVNELAPFGFGNPEPVFSSRSVSFLQVRLIGAERKHLKLQVGQNGQNLEAVAFGMARYLAKINQAQKLDIAYSIDLDNWNGNSRLQLKIKDIHFN